MKGWFSMYDKILLPGFIEKNRILMKTIQRK